MGIIDQGDGVRCVPRIGQKMLLHAWLLLPLLYCLIDQQTIDENSFLISLRNELVEKLKINIRRGCELPASRSDIEVTT